MNSASLVFYPSYTYKASPTFHKWVKITAKDIHGLLDRRGNDALRHLWFHLNHPIQYVDIIAPVVAIEPLTKKYALLTIDDGSGLNIGVKISRLLEADPNIPENEDAATVTVVDFPSNTTIANVNVRAGLGEFEVEIDDIRVNIGTIIRAKCTICLWFGTKQLDLQRANIVKTTRREVESWREVARFKRKILSKPWVLPKEEVRRLEAAWKAEQKEEQRQRTRWNEYRQKKQQKERKEEAIYEKSRREQEQIMDEGALI